MMLSQISTSAGLTQNTTHEDPSENKDNQYSKEKPDDDASNPKEHVETPFEGDAEICAICGIKVVNRKQLWEHINSCDYLGE
ncbi:hypothetical protein COEREDRAFT_83144 [Coemansia reversa NRRL 1564]|uniref:Uncharacterized protein n=1 Tax=Coemansia reversa (strain ATCC 12441 / NRRL 1564) TaxID=763665 RepID=A0A2G5B4C5_COERN|nr:hypothetical protein COEREDRAFT_83144 [Coemansia reversa NRRL 1564]|eukprot:PIA13852.1 hypothetical protein COEREDRAFT_83144 [Coemansia reversa NRRL 1564]